MEEVLLSLFSSEEQKIAHVALSVLLHPLFLLCSADERRRGERTHRLATAKSRRGSSSSSSVKQERFLAHDQACSSLDSWFFRLLAFFCSRGPHVVEQAPCLLWRTGREGGRGKRRRLEREREWLKRVSQLCACVCLCAVLVRSMICFHVQPPAAGAATSA